MLGELQKKDLQIIKDTNNWSYFVLPIVNRSSEQPGKGPRCAFLVRGHGSKLYLMNMWELHEGSLEPQLADVKILKFDSFEAMLEAGWEVD
jgi:hypothetical protein